VTDRQTDGRTDRIALAITAVCIASCKNRKLTDEISYLTVNIVTCEVWLATFHDYFWPHNVVDCGICNENVYVSVRASVCLSVLSHSFNVSKYALHVP